MIALFIIISVALLIVTGHTPEEWKEIFTKMNE